MEQLHSGICELGQLGNGSMPIYCHYPKIIMTPYPFGHQWTNFGENLNQNRTIFFQENALKMSE